MQPLKILHQWLVQNTNKEHYLFAYNDFRALFPRLSDNAFKALMSRAVSAQILTRVCRGIFLYEPSMSHDGLLLFHVAALLRADSLNYISLETVLSDVGVISQIPINTITIMSSGRSHVVRCNTFARIEFVHTSRKPTDLVDTLYYDQRCGLWRATVAHAIQDMKLTRRNCDLIDWELVNELI